MAQGFEFDIQACMTELMGDHLVFYSEGDFKFNLSLAIMRKYPNARIAFEYPFCFESEQGIERCHLDMLIECNDLQIPIEIKYITAKLSWKDSDGREYELKRHGANDYARYDCLKDIQRVERMLEKQSQPSMGYAVWLTNEKALFEVPEDEITSNDAAFRIHAGTCAKRTMEWDDLENHSVSRKRQNPISLGNEYSIRWHEYSDVGVDHGLFKYSIIEVQAV